MKKILILMLLFPAFICQAQTIDSAGRLAASYFKEAETASKDQKLWNEKLYGPILFVNEQTRFTYSNQQDSAGIFKPDGDIFKGVLPKDVMVANTSINWQGKDWSVILWPLPQDHDERLNLIIHESFHRIQRKLGLASNSPTADHLSTMYGRIYFLLELQALKAALGKPINKRTPDLKNALLFRYKRQQLFPGTFNKERLLEMNEGLAEYTGVMLGRHRDSILKHLYEVIDGFKERKSFIRSFPYISGPAYGYLLYQKYPGWTLKIDSNASFPSLISRYYHFNISKNDMATNKIANLYSGKSIIAAEELKDAEHKKLIKQYTDVFTKEPVLTISLMKMNINFNPNNLFDLGDYGTVYPTCLIKDVWGELQVSENGMLMKDWQIVYLPMSQFSAVNDRIIEGKGWRINLNDDWKIIKMDSLHYKLTK